MFLFSVFHIFLHETKLENKKFKTYDDYFYSSATNYMIQYNPLKLLTFHFIAFDTGLT